MGLVGGWNSVKISEVNPGFDLVPAGTYNFVLLGAKPGAKDPERIDVRAVIETEGENKGRNVFFSYSNPDVWKLSPKALKRLEVSMGIDITEEEDGDSVAGKIAYLNRAAQEGGRFSATVKHRKYVHPESGEETITADLQPFSVGPIK